MSTEGHFCDNCGCGWEHGCVCGNCDNDYTPTTKEVREAYQSSGCGVAR